MRFAVLSLLLIGTLILSGCAGDLRSQSPPQKWAVGFWYWGGFWAPDFSPSTHSPDALYVEVGTFREPQRQQQALPLYASIPTRLPQAHEYWLVYRYDSQGVPSKEGASEIAWNYLDALREARRRNLNIAGIQLDIDSPTNSLPKYAVFLRTLRSELPAGTKISITCLLDWFRNGTSVADVISQTDEFVPQFYDAGLPDSNSPVIAVRFDADHWSPIFNRFGKRFRIGISTFGRAVQVDLPQSGPYKRLARVYGDLTPLDLALNPAFHASTSENDAGETVLTFSSVTLNETYRFVLPTPEGIHRAVASAHRMGGYCAGVVFFRWSATDEALVMPADELLGYPPTPSLDLIDGACAAVSCMDIYLTNGGTLNRMPLHYRIIASDNLDYFLPDRKLPLQMSGGKDIELSIPSWGGRGRLYIGRAVSTEKVTFSLEKIR